MLVACRRAAFFLQAESRVAVLQIKILHLQMAGACQAIEPLQLVSSLPAVGLLFGVVPRRSASTTALVAAEKDTLGLALKMKRRSAGCACPRASFLGALLRMVQRRNVRRTNRVHLAGQVNQKVASPETS
jgi:hypothetical protein